MLNTKYNSTETLVLDLFTTQRYEKNPQKYATLANNRNFHNAPAAQTVQTVAYRPTCI